MHTPEVITEATLTYIIDVGGFTTYRDSGGPIGDEEGPSRDGGVDVAILSINGRRMSPSSSGRLPARVELYQPKILIPRTTTSVGNRHRP